MASIIHTVHEQKFPVSKTDAKQYFLSTHHIQKIKKGLHAYAHKPFYFLTI